MTLLTNLKANFCEFNQSIMYSDLDTSQLLEQLQKQQPEVHTETIDYENFQEMCPEEALNFFTQFSKENSFGTKIYQNSEHFLEKLEDEKNEVIFESEKDKFFDGSMNISYFQNKIQELKG